MDVILKYVLWLRRTVAGLSPRVPGVALGSVDSGCGTGFAILPLIQIYTLLILQICVA